MRGRALFSTSMIISVLLIVGKYLGFVRETWTASFFGVTFEADAFFLALLIPNLLTMLVGGAVGTTVIPSLVRMRMEGDRQGYWGMVNAVGVLLVGTLVALGGLTYLLRYPLLHALAPDYTPDQVEVVVHSMLWMLPMVVFSGLNGLLSALLQAEKKYMVSTISNLLGNVAVLAVLYATHATWGINGLALAMLSGVMVSCLTQIPSCWRLGYQASWMSFADPKFRLFGALYATATLSLALTQVSLVIERHLSVQFESGAVAALNYANKLVAFPSSLLVTVISVLLYPTLVERSREGDFAREAGKYLQVILYLSVPIACFFWMGAHPILEAVLQRGRFDAASTDMTAQAFAFYAAGFPFVVLVDYMTRLFYIQGDSKRSVLIVLISTASNIALNLLLVRVWGFAGLALGNSLAQAVTFLAQLLVYRSRHAGVAVDGWGAFLTKMLVTSVLTVLPLAVLRSLGLGVWPLLVGSLLLGAVGFVVLHLWWRTPTRLLGAGARPTAQRG